MQPNIGFAHLVCGLTLSCSLDRDVQLLRIPRSTSTMAGSSDEECPSSFAVYELTEEDNPWDIIGFGSLSFEHATAIHPIEV